MAALKLDGHVMAQIQPAGRGKFKVFLAGFSDTWYNAGGRLCEGAALAKNEARYQIRRATEALRVTDNLFPLYTKATIHAGDKENPGDNAFVAVNVNPDVRWVPAGLVEVALCWSYDEKTVHMAFNSTERKDPPSGASIDIEAMDALAAGWLKMRGLL